MTIDLSSDAVLSLLTGVRFFVDLDAAERAEVAHIIGLRRVGAGEIVFRQGDTGDAWYVIAEGRLTVRASRDGGGGDEQVVASLGRGDCVGELAVLDGAPRTATVRAEEDCVLLRLDRGRFTDLLAHGSLGAYKLVLSIARELADRQRRMLGAMLQSGQDRDHDDAERHTRAYEVIAAS